MHSITRFSTANIYSVLSASTRAAALIVLLGGHCYGQEGTQESWTKIDCASADAHLLPPAGVQANCFQGPFTQPKDQTYSCRLFNYSIGFPPDGTEPRFHVVARYPNKGGKVCAVIPFPDPVNAMQHVHKFVENGATNWSAMQPVGDDIQVMFFDAKNQKRDGKCFTFIKLGPSAGYAGKGHLFSMIGFFCKAPGQSLDATMAAAMANAVQLKM
jgi:hypothetical protein